MQLDYTPFVSAIAQLDKSLVYANSPLTLAQLAELQEAFESSDLTIGVDVVDWASISGAFRQLILRDKVVVQDASSPTQS